MIKKRSLSTMTPPELIAEIAKMDAAIERLKDTRDQAGLSQLAACRAIKFACECQMNGRKLSPAPAPMPADVISLSEYRLKRAQRNG